MPDDIAIPSEAIAQATVFAVEDEPADLRAAEKDARRVLRRLASKALLVKTDPVRAIYRSAVQGGEPTAGRSDRA
ncbi:hypothetical protein [Streptomyces sp. NBC_00620]|uniref:hypothetical protein n=1 Tax=Streptomyces sp. NBC_00620 TaxID=2903666 RepID=UPI0022560983|nr:hypothetical protein [Streptomyces sp. NBC_00620]MCX4977452.1 hypothetical protein [Streptomyces sp. NBC_00620]